jgi:aromatic ring-cleaving dioxygenase
MDPARIKDWHAHIYFDAATREAAWALREKIDENFTIEMGRFHEKPVGPHPRFSYQVLFTKDQFADIVPWLALNRGGLTILVHPNTGEALEDHRDRGLWLGTSEELHLDVLRKTT